VFNAQCWHTCLQPSIDCLESVCSQ
jgi:hypothetical protein